MPKLTLLDMTQRILSSMDSDAVDSFSDTVESEQVAYIIRDTYYDLINNIEIPEHRKLVPLTALADTTKPSTMKVPENIRRIDEVRYDTILTGDSIKAYEVVSWVEPYQFLSDTLSRQSTDSTVVTVTVPTSPVATRSSGVSPSLNPIPTGFHPHWMFLLATNSALSGLGSRTASESCITI